MTTVIKWLAAFSIVFVMAALMSVELDTNQAEHDKPLPALKLTDLITGETVQLNKVEGRFLLNVWGSWCVACAREHDLLLQLKQSDIRIVGVAYMDSADKARQWLNKKGNPYARSLLDTEGALGKALEIKGAPESYLVDSTGRIRYKHTGMLTEENWPAIAAEFAKIK